MRSDAYKRTRLACYTAYFTMASIFCLPPLLFAHFHSEYGVSYTLLGTLVLTNFITQLGVDLLFSFLSRRCNIGLIIKIMPLITFLGLTAYALSPVLFPESVYVGFLVGTVLFSVSAGLSEVLLSPLIAALPSENPQRDMSLLHSLYAFGVLFVVAVSSLFFALFGADNWQILTAFFALLPVLASVLFFLSPMPDMNRQEGSEGQGNAFGRVAGIALCVGCIFLGSCAENVMASWASSYIENALNLDKIFGDMLGMAAFAVLLGFMRIWYAKRGKSIFPILLGGMIGAAACYLTAGLVENTWVALCACALTGLFAAMLWPGSLIMMEENLPGVGVAAYALMAAGGDLGASVAPQLMGFVVDSVSVSNFALQLSASTGLTVEQIGMKAGMLVTAIFPILGAVLLIFTFRYFKRLHQSRGVSLKK
ncbi:MAG: MFS transporter [Clostridia bacterium]|nr:MFS transporter [Clostridia bacterium]